MPLIPALRRLREEDYEFESSLSYREGGRERVRKEEKKS
jgi:hypothetical protein